MEGSIEDIIDVLKWAGLEWDEGPGATINIDSDASIGKFGPYVQSERLDIYKKYCNHLLEAGDAYCCFCTQERLQEMRIKIGGAKYAKAAYDRTCLELPREVVEERIANGESYMVRMKVPNGKTEIKDIVRGKVVFDNKDVDD